MTVKWCVVLCPFMKSTFFLNSFLFHFFFHLGRIDFEIKPNMSSS